MDCVMSVLDPISEIKVAGSWQRLLMLLIFTTSPLWKVINRYQQISTDNNRYQQISTGLMSSWNFFSCFTDFTKKSSNWSRAWQIWRVQLMRMRGLANAAGRTHSMQWSGKWGKFRKVHLHRARSSRKEDPYKSHPRHISCHTFTSSSFSLTKCGSKIVKIIRSATREWTKMI